MFAFASWPFSYNSLSFPDNRHHDASLSTPRSHQGAVRIASNAGFKTAPNAAESNPVSRTRVKSMPCAAASPLTYCRVTSNETPPTAPVAPPTTACLPRRATVGAILVARPPSARALAVAGAARVATAAASVAKSAVRLATATLRAWLIPGTSDVTPPATAPAGPVAAFCAKSKSCASFVRSCTVASDARALRYPPAVPAATVVVNATAPAAVPLSSAAAISPTPRPAPTPAVAAVTSRAAPIAAATTHPRLSLPSGSVLTTGLPFTYIYRLKLSVCPAGSTLAHRASHGA